VSDKPTVEYTTTEALIFDRERLRAEVERLNGLLDHSVELMNDSTVASGFVLSELADLRAENERLTDALIHIRNLAKPEDLFGQIADDALLGRDKELKDLPE